MRCISACGLTIAWSVCRSGWTYGGSTGQIAHVERKSPSGQYGEVRPRFVTEGSSAKNLHPSFDSLHSVFRPAQSQIRTSQGCFFIIIIILRWMNTNRVIGRWSSLRWTVACFLSSIVGIYSGTSSLEDYRNKLYFFEQPLDIQIIILNWKGVAPILLYTWSGYWIGCRNFISAPVTFFLSISFCYNNNVILRNDNI